LPQAATTPFPHHVQTQTFALHLQMLGGTWFEFAVSAILFVYARAAIRGPRSLSQDPWKRCWNNQLVAAACCQGVWGGVGCWDDGRSYSWCCTQRSLDRRNEPPPQPQCEQRLAKVAAKLNADMVYRLLVSPVESQVANLRWPLAHEHVLEPFLSGPSPLAQVMLLQLVELVAGVFEERKITFWAHGNTLVGVLRHYGPIPWDDESELGVFANEMQDVVEALQTVRDKGHLSFGPVVMSAVPVARCVRNCGQWLLSFARGIVYNTSKFRHPAVRITWFDPRGESSSWREHFGVSSTHGLARHRLLLAKLLPAHDRRPYATLWLPTPRDPLAILDAQFRAGSCRGEVRHVVEMCHIQACRKTGTPFPVATPQASSLPCAALAVAFPVVLVQRAFNSETLLLQELGTVTAKAGGNKVHGSALGGGHAVDQLPRLSFSVEVAVDVARGAHVLLLGQEELAGSNAKGAVCWVHIYGSHSLLKGNTSSI